MTHKAQISLQLPKIQDLCYVECRINAEEMQHPIIKSLWHCQILTCRLIIDTVKCCIAAPSVKNIVDHVHVIVSKKFYSSGKLQQHLHQLKIQFTASQSVHSNIYKACLKYTIAFKIAPHWNSVGKKFYIYRSDFLSQPMNDAIEWDILFNEDGERLELKPIKVNLSPINLEILGLPNRITRDFKEKNNFPEQFINLTLFQCPSVYVLPRLTRGKVVSVSKNLPESCPYDNYNDLRRYWKNMYSYHLPKNQVGMLFYEVIFPITNQRFTYPEMCILLKTPEIHICSNKNEVALRFIKDLYSKVYSVCGTPIKFNHVHPQLEVGYSCEFQTTLSNNKYNEQDICEFKSSFFKIPVDNIGNTFDEKLNLPSSGFTFRNYKIVNESMTDDPSQTVSVIGTKRKKNSLLNGNYGNNFYGRNDDLFKNKKDNKNKKCKNNKNSHLPNDLPLNIACKETIIENIDDVCSFYDIPSMNKEYLKSLNERNNVFNINGSQTNNITNDLPATKFLSNNDSFQQTSSIKNIENVCFDFADIKTKTQTIRDFQSINNTHSPNLPQQAILNSKIAYQNDDFNLSENTMEEYVDNENYIREINLHKQASDDFLHNKSISQHEVLPFNLESPNNHENHKTFTQGNSCSNEQEKLNTKSISDLRLFYLNNYESAQKLDEEFPDQSMDNSFLINDSIPLSPSLLEDIEMQHENLFYETQNDKIIHQNNNFDKVEFDKSNNMSDYYQDSENVFNNINNTKSNDFSSIEYKLDQEESLYKKSWCEIPSMISKTITNTESTNNMFQSFNENENKLEKIISYNCAGDEKINKIDNIADDAFEVKKYSGDFHSILSQSSNEDLSASQESYKVSCTEALTFEN